MKPASRHSGHAHTHRQEDVCVYRAPWVAIYLCYMHCIFQYDNTGLCKTRTIYSWGLVEKSSSRFVVSANRLCRFLSLHLILYYVHTVRLERASRRTSSLSLRLVLVWLYIYIYILSICISPCISVWRSSPLSLNLSIPWTEISRGRDSLLDVSGV